MFHVKQAKNVAVMRTEIGNFHQLAVKDVYCKKILAMKVKVPRTLANPFLGLVLLFCSIGKSQETFLIIITFSIPKWS